MWFDKIVGSIEDNVKTVFDNIAEAARKSGRKPEDVILVAASKTNSAERVREAFGAGVRYFGENRVQEMTEKAALGAYSGAQIHFIGHLQRNKVKNVVGSADLIQSVDSDELLELISRRAAGLGIVQDILLEVNIGAEESKSGVLPEGLDELAAKASALPGISVKGLMTIPPVSADPLDSVRYFDRMYKLFVDISAKKYDNITMDILSMGMSADYAEAISAGANMVRVGSAIFGARQYTK